MLGTTKEVRLLWYSKWKRASWGPETRWREEYSCSCSHPAEFLDSWNRETVRNNIHYFQVKAIKLWIDFLGMGTSLENVPRSLHFWACNEEVQKFSSEENTKSVPQWKAFDGKSVSLCHLTGTFSLKTQPQLDIFMYHKTTFHCVLSYTWQC